MSGFIDSSWSINSCCRAGDIIKGIVLFSTLRSENFIAMRCVIEVAGDDSTLFVGKTDSIMSIGYALGTKN